MPRARVLLADSSAFCLEIEKSFLKEWAVTIFTARDGARALEVARKVRPNLICLDSALPLLDGPSCCRAIKADPALTAIPVIMVTTSSDRDQAACREAGCDALLIRPLDRRQFLETGKSLLVRIEEEETRIPCRLTVACRLAGKAFYGTIEDISVNGMFVGSSRDVQVGDNIEVKFLLPGEQTGIIETGAQISWVNRGKRRRNSQMPVGFGTVFNGIDPGAVEQIREFIDRSLLWRQPPDDM